MVDTARHQSILEHRLLRSLRKVWMVKHWRFASKNGVSLPRPSLPISHNNPIKPIQYILNHRFGYLFIRKSLVWFSIQHAIKEKVPSIILLPLERYLLPSDTIDGQAISFPIQILLMPIHRRHGLVFLRLRCSHFRVFLEKRPDPNHYSEVGLLLFLRFLQKILMRLDVRKLMVGLWRIIQMIESIHFIKIYCFL